MASLVLGVPITSVDSFSLERFRKLLGAVTLLHAHHLGINRATGAMKHVGTNISVEFWLILHFGDLCTNNTVNLLSCPDLVLWLQNDQNVGMGQASFLVLNHVNYSTGPPKYLALLMVLEHGI